jgi:AcrR family transcriptional regulator
VAAVKPKRKYASALRRRQAEETRGRILDAAESLFAERGYASTTMTAIAEAAGVAPDTVYATFSSKVGLLHGLLDARVGGDTEPVSLLDRPGPKAVLEEKDARRLVNRFAGSVTEILERAARVARILRGAAAVDLEVAELLARMEGTRHANLTSVAGALDRMGSLRKGVDARRATAVIWTLASPDVHRLLRIERRWSPAEYATWLADTLVRTLLETPGSTENDQTQGPAS